jgi:hypothetical protein
VLGKEWAALLRRHAGEFAEIGLANIRREFPSDVHHIMTRAGDFPFRPKARNPVFYGSFDWHSCIEMHWMLVRLLRVTPDVVPAAGIRAALNGHYHARALRAEAEYVASRGGQAQCPYGWTALLALAAEAQCLADADGQKWAAGLAVIADAVCNGLLAWLARASYPVRHGAHANSAFSLSRALRYARRRARDGDGALLEAITEKAHTWFDADMIYPGAWEPSGEDFLSPALCEAELMAALLPRQEFSAWLAVFLPGIAGGEPAALFRPAVVSDASFGRIAHLHGLNASRAWCWRRIAESLPPGDPRIAAAEDAGRRHADAMLSHVGGGDYLVEHWLAAFAVLALS